MFRVSRLLGLFIGAVMLLGALSAQARSGSVLINKRPIRARLNKLVRGDALRLGKPVFGPTRGVSALAFKKARQTAQGFNGFNYRAGAKNFVLSRGKASRLVVTTANISSWAGPGRMNYFVARDGKSGVVVGRGYVQGGKIAWTRSKNERGKLTPSERNAAAR